MWSYYGAKTNIVKFYPAPKHDKIIEPFCGTARYALRYFDRDILIVDKYDVIIKIWQWLQKCSPQDILSLPRFKAGENINNYTYDCEEQRLLIGFTIGFGFYEPRHLATIRLRDRPNHQNYALNKIASQLWKIKHWNIRLGSYESIENENASWFIDPPYKIGGHVYRCNNKQIDYSHLAEWCKSRIGQTIVCEHIGADWLNFIPFVDQNIRTGQFKEGIWSNEKTEYDNIQQKLDL